MVYAGFWRRFAAYVIDIVIIDIVLGLFSIGTLIHMDKIIDLSTQDADRFTVTLSYSGLSLLVGWIYFAAFQSSKHQGTPGMMVLGIRIVDYAGKRISFGRATGRFVAAWLSTLILFIGYLMIAFTPRKQGLHDYIAKTLVIDGDKK